MSETTQVFEDEKLEAAQQLARAAVGEEDEAAYLQLVMAAYNAAHWVSTAKPEERGAIAAQLQARTSGTAAPAGADDVPSIQNDPTYTANQLKVVRLHTRIVGASPIPPTQFSDCVAVGSGGRFCCSGTLIAPRVVVTAGHCHGTVPADPCSQRVFVGMDIKEPGRVIDVEEAIMHPDYVPRDDSRPFDDLTVLLLAEEVEDVTPRKLASLEALADAPTTRLVGFGNTDFDGTTGYGTKRMVDVGIASDDPAYGARPETEFVAGMPGLNRDSCTGDSGGPAYIEVDGEWQLAGATSRATGKSRRNCGDGGVYTRVAAYRDWIESEAGPLG
jgi:secreted trypsin-like serine protease